MQNNIPTKIIYFLENAQGHPLDIYTHIFQENVDAGQEPQKVLQDILQNSFIEVGSDEAPADIMSDAAAQKIKKLYYNLLHEIVRVLAAGNPTVEDFYSQLYQKVFESGLFPENRQVKAVLIQMLANEIPELPYYQADNLLEMTNEEYRKGIDRVKPSLYEAIHMLNRHFESRTKEASQLCRIASELADEADRVIYWSIVIDLLRRFGQSRRQTPDADPMSAT